jgi:putative ABC transport system ATP-binding protein
MSELLSTTHLIKQYITGSAQVQALAGVDLVIKRGEFAAIMGPSGSGKSTLLHLLGGLDGPSDGEITLAGQRLARLDDDRLSVVRRQQIGFIFQFFNLLPTLSAWENVALPLLIDGREVRKYAGRIDELLDQVGLADRSHHRPSELSGGQQQRVAIARALVTEPALVLADEPTGNLDSASGKEVLALLRRACDERGQTIVMVTHDQTAAKVADRVIHMRDGQIVK